MKVTPLIDYLTKWLTENIIKFSKKNFFYNTMLVLQPLNWKIYKANKIDVSDKSDRVIEWLSDWVTEWLSNWVTDWVTEGQTFT